ncbi:MAG: DUF6036 family nucleotidyltransferase [Chloroflexota bacterium]
METVTSLALQKFFQRLGEQISTPATFYLLGGSALCLLGSPRETLDVDYSIEGALPEMEQALKQLSAELELDLELVPLREFIPLPPDAEQSRRFVGRYGQVDVYIFDLYSIALSKIARGFESDLEDVEFLLRQKLIAWGPLEAHFKSILPRAKSADIDPQEFQAYFDTLKRKMKRP